MKVYVDDIIFGATSHSLSNEFADLMSSEFQMSMMGGSLPTYLDYKSESLLRAHP